MFGALHSKRLIYRALEVEDEPFLSRIGQDTESYMNAASFLPIPQGKSGAATSCREWLETGMIATIICLPTPATSTASTDDAASKPTPIGFIQLAGLESRQMQNRHSDIAITLDRVYQGQGYGTEAIQWIIQWGFRHAGLHHIMIGAYSHNSGAIRLYERIGFTVEGRKREHIWHDGEFSDQVELGMLESEWREKYGKELQVLHSN